MILWDAHYITPCFQLRREFHGHRMRERVPVCHSVRVLEFVWTQSLPKVVDYGPDVVGAKAKSTLGFIGTLLRSDPIGFGPAEKFRFAESEVLDTVSH